MLLAYLLLFLLHLSASACDATSRNHRLLLPADVHASSPASHDHRRIAKDLSYRLHYYAMTAPQGGPPPPPTVEVSRGVEGVRPAPEKEISAAMEPSPSPSSWQVDGGYGEARGGDLGGGGERGSSWEATATDQEERRADVDYEPPKAHPPSHN